MNDLSREVLRMNASEGRLSDAGLAQVVERLRAGALIVYPTDTLYAIGCLATDETALARLRSAKGREETKAFPIIVGNESQAMDLAIEWPLPVARLTARFWPGPLTLVLDARAGLPPSLLASGTTLAVRVPDSTLARQLALAAGPLVSTSANLSGGMPLTTAARASEAFPHASVVIDGGELDGAPSTIVDPRGPSAIVLREGRIPRSALDEALISRP